MIDPLSFAKRLARPIRTAYRRYSGDSTEASRVAFLRSNVQLRFAAPGHFYSPLPDLVDFPESTSSADCLGLGIDLREQDQCAMLDQLSRFYPDLPFSDEPDQRTRYYYKNDFFGHGDAIVLSGMMRLLRPKMVIEVGSGFSSAAMLDTDEIFLDRGVSFVFIEPYADRLRTLLNPNDRVSLLEQPVQKVDLDAFAGLAKDDILFIDSSHVSKFGSDVNDLFFRIIPSLARGVLIHFHDVFWPFEYPVHWLKEGRAWNECYLLRAFLQYNDCFEIVYFNDFMAKMHSDLIGAKMPLILENTGGSIWLRKIK